VLLSQLLLLLLLAILLSWWLVARAALPQVLVAVVVVRRVENQATVICVSETVIITMTTHNWKTKQVKKSLENNKIKYYQVVKHDILYNRNEHLSFRSCTVSSNFLKYLIQRLQLPRHSYLSRLSSLLTGLFLFVGST
jgi:hypothetical protein